MSDFDAQFAAYAAKKASGGPSFDFASLAQAQQPKFYPGSIPDRTPPFQEFSTSSPRAFNPIVDVFGSPALMPSSSGPAGLGGQPEAAQSFDAAFAAHAANRRSFVSDFAGGLATNNPPQGVGGYLGRAAPGVIGSMVGTPAGPLGMGASAAAFQSLRDAVANFLSAQDPQKYGAPMGASDVLGDVAKTGAVNAAVPAGVDLAKGALATGTPGAVRAGAQIIQAASGVPARYGQGALSGALENAPTLAENSAAYEQLFNANGLKSLDQATVQATGKTVPTTGDYGRILERSMRLYRSGWFDLQDAIFGSQAASKLKMLAKFGNPEYQGSSAALDEAKSVLDAAIEQRLPGYADLRQGRFAAKTAEAFSNLLPQNRGGTANVLRSKEAVMAMLGSAGTLAATGNPLLAVLPAAYAASVSPATWGLGIRAGRAAAGMGAAVAPYMGSPLLQAYEAQGNR